MNNDEACALEAANIELAIIDIWHELTSDDCSPATAIFNRARIAGAAMSATDNMPLLDDLDFLFHLSYQFGKPL